MKKTINKLYEFIAKLVLLLENELNELEVSKAKNSSKIKKNITEALNRLVTLIIQLNKLSKEEVNKSYEMNQEDKDIIKRFIEKYNGRMEDI